MTHTIRPSRGCVCKCFEGPAFLACYVGARTLRDMVNFKPWGSKPQVDPTCIAPTVDIFETLGALGKATLGLLQTWAVEQLSGDQTVALMLASARTRKHPPCVQGQCHEPLRPIRGPRKHTLRVRAPKSL